MATARTDIEARINPVAPISTFDPVKEKLQRRMISPFKKTGNGVLDFARNHASDSRFVPAGTELFAEGETTDNVYVVLNGWLFLNRILEDGRRQILDFALPGAVLGYHAHPETIFTFSAEAITNAEVAIIPISRVRDLLQRGSACAISLLEAANQSLLGAFDTLTDVGRRTAREAVAHFLLRMSRRIRAQSDTSAAEAVSFPLSQEHIGDALGLTSVHVCRTLGKLRNDGLVEIGHGRLRIIDADALAEDASVYHFDEDEIVLAH
jgi:CRP/FNR family transcriptional regulator